MPIEHVATILCETVIQAVDGNFSFINVYTNIQLPTLPGGLQHLYIVVALSGNPGDPFSITMEGPDGKTQVIDGHDVLPDFPEDYDHRALRKVNYSMILVKDARFLEEGMHHVVLSSGDRIVHREPFGVRLLAK